MKSQINKKALISVANKEGIVELARSLKGLNFVII
ncbi:unnamed protein product, partial [marine sediment metagenome]